MKTLWRGIHLFIYYCPMKNVFQDIMFLENEIYF